MREVMMKGKFMGLLLILLSPMTALSVTNAWGLEEMTGTDASGAWSVHVTAEDGLCGYNKSGNPIPCTTFGYEVIAHPAGVFPIQANIRIPICESGSEFSIVIPTDFAVKIRDCDPNSRFVCDDLFADALTWDALKDAPSTQDDFSVAVTPASIEETTLSLTISSGTVLVPTLGPGCCSKVQRITEVTYSLPNSGAGWEFDPSTSHGSVVATFNACSGDQTGVVYDPDVPNESGFYEYQVLPGAFLCLGDTTTYFKSTCKPTKKFGPVTGTMFYTTDYAYFGWGSNIWKGPGIADYPPIIPDVTCTEPADAPFPALREYAGAIQLNQDQCGNLISATFQNELLFPTTDQFWLCEADARGRLDAAACSRILTGNQDDAVVDGSCYIVSGGRRIYCATCSCR